MKLWLKITSQFGKPTGSMGSVAGFIMSYRKSNIERNQWAVQLLNLQPGDNVLEIGFGPGLAIKMISEAVTGGLVYGIDHSEKMLKLARKKNIDGVTSGRVALSCISISDMPETDVSFDKILDVNSFQFWESPVEDLIKLRRNISAGGFIALVHQPRKPGATDEDAIQAGNDFSNLLKRAGFKNIEIHKKFMKPVSAVCVTGKIR